MSEAIPLPVMEIRERFTPSELLLESLGDLLQPPLGEDDVARLGASFLFQSYRRRLKHQADYFTNEYEHQGEIYKATEVFNKLPQFPKYKISLTEPLLDRNLGYSQARLIMRAQATPDNEFPLKVLNNILSSIKTIEPESDKAIDGIYFYVPLNKSMLAHDLKERFTTFQALTRNAETDQAFYIEPDALVTRSTVLYQSEPPGAA